VRASEKDCPTCASFCWFPNVRKASEPEEVAELTIRCDAAKALAESRGAGGSFAVYETELADSVVVVCRSLDQAKTLLSNDSSVYISYYGHRASGGRRAEETAIEIQREATDVRMFPSYHDEVRFGALSLDGRGVRTFGVCSLVLKSFTIQQRTSFFWENSVIFCNRVCPQQTDPIPAGFRAPWPTRAALAVAKGEPLLTGLSTSAEFSRILLDGDRFVEAHIYGPFNRESVDRILLPKTLVRSDRAMVSAIRDVIRQHRLGIKIEEYS
jgi:hypothetical protein